MRKHTKVTPYACDRPGCPKVFAWRSSLGHHQKHHERLDRKASMATRKLAQNPQKIRKSLAKRSSSPKKRSKPRMVSSARPGPSTKAVFAQSLQSSHPNRRKGIGKLETAVNQAQIAESTTIPTTKLNPRRENTATKCEPTKENTGCLQFETSPFVSDADSVASSFGDQNENFPIPRTPQKTLESPCAKELLDDSRFVDWEFGISYPLYQFPRDVWPTQLSQPWPLSVDDSDRMMDFSFECLSGA